MASLKELRTRIEAVKSTAKITSAMKMVAASRLRKFQSVITYADNYQNAIITAIQRILADIKQEEIEKKTHFVLPEMMTQKKQVKTCLLLVFSSDKGLCGNYNSVIYKSLMQHVNELKQKNIRPAILCLGKKIYNFAKKHYPEFLIENQTDISNKEPDFAESLQFAEQIITLYKENNFDICEVISAKFRTALSRDIVCEQLLPVNIKQSDDKYINKVGDAYYFYEPNRYDLLENLLPMLFAANIFNVIVQSQASEQGARMSSMDNANKNAKNMISELTLKYNTIRQSAITTELTEIISGAEAI